MTLLYDLPAALEAAGVIVRTLDGWENPAKPGYYWREKDSNPAGAMWHHTASSTYVPNRDKANGWLGLGRDDTDRLYQSTDGGYPVYVVANAWPAPISSGYGVRAVLDQFVKADIPFTGQQTLPDDDWAGNTHYWNTEVVLDGVGSEMRSDVWSTMVRVAVVLNDMLDWTPARHIAHAHHTRRKIDLRDGRYRNADETIRALRKDIAVDPDCPWTTNSDYPPCQRHYTPPTDMPRGNGPGQHQGQCNVPDTQHEAVEWAFESGRFKAGNGYRYDYATILTEGREMVFEWRDAT